MKRLAEVFNKEALWDHAKGAIMGASAGLVFGAHAAIAGGFVGLILGGQRITEAFNAAVFGHQMAYAAAAVPAVRAITRKL